MQSISKGAFLPRFTSDAICIAGREPPVEFRIQFSFKRGSTRTILNKSPMFIDIFSCSEHRRRNVQSALKGNANRFRQYLNALRADDTSYRDDGSYHLSGKRYNGQMIFLANNRRVILSPQDGRRRYQGHRYHPKAIWDRLIHSSGRTFLSTHDLVFQPRSPAGFRNRFPIAEASWRTRQPGSSQNWKTRQPGTRFPARPDFRRPRGTCLERL